MIKRLVIRFVILCVFLTTGQSAHAAYLFLDPSTKESIAVDETFTINLRINTEGEKVQAAEAWIDFDATELEYIDAKDPGAAEKFFSNSLIAKDSAVLIYIANWITLGTDAISSTVGKDSIAVMRFKAIKPGTYSLTIRCKQGSTTDSAIAARKNKKTEDIIDCSKTESGSYVVSGTATTTTPQPTSPNRTTPTTTQPRTTLTPLPTTRPGDPTLTPSLTPTATPTLVPTAAATSTPSPSPTVAGTGGSGITAVPTQMATTSALPATGDVQSVGIIVGIGLLLTAVSIFVKVFVL